MSEIRIFLLIFSFLLISFVTELVRRRHLREKYSLVWIFISLPILALSIWPGLLERFSQMFGVYYPPSLGFIAGIIILLVITLMLSVVVSHQSDKITRMIQEQAILENRLRKLEEDSKK